VTERLSGNLLWTFPENKIRRGLVVPTDRDVEWKPISTAPFNRDLELAVIDKDGIHALVFPSRRLADGWAKAQTNKRIDVSPTHWREWAQDS